MMGKLYFVANAFIPNTAPCNRWLGFMRGVSELGVPATFVFFLPDKERSKIGQNFDGITIDYCWGGKMPSRFFRNRIMRQLMIVFMSIIFVCKLHRGDTVFILEISNFLFIVLRKKGVRVFHERTEHPFAYPYKAVNIKHYVNCVHRLDGLFVISRPLKDYFIEHGVSSDKVFIINMFADQTRFTGLKRTEARGRYIAYCGSFFNSKDGVDDLIKAFAIVHSRLPDVKLLIIGKKLEANQTNTNVQLVDSLDLRSFVEFSGVIPYEQMPQVLNDATVLALNRPDNLQAKYGFPTKLGEYLLTERPVVITAVGDIPYFLEDKKSALLSSPSNNEEFAKKLCWALEHPDEANEIGRYGAQVAKKHFNYLTETRKMLTAMGYL